MQELAKKTFHTVVGLAAMASEKIQGNVDQVVKQGEKSQKEGEKVMKSFWKTSTKRREQFQETMRKATEKVTSSIDFPKRTDITSLIDRLESLEVKLGVTEKPAKAKATPKRATKKATK